MTERKWVRLSLNQLSQALAELGQMKALNLERSDICPQWNYTIRPLGVSS
jgi:hypothetical protein